MPFPLLPTPGNRPEDLLDVISEAITLIREDRTSTGTTKARALAYCASQAAKIQRIAPQAEPEEGQVDLRKVPFSKLAEDDAELKEAFDAFRKKFEEIEATLSEGELIDSDPDRNRPLTHAMQLCAMKDPDL